jgi:hypothetical protein
MIGLMLPGEHALREDNLGGPFGGMTIGLQPESATVPVSHPGRVRAAVT